MITPFAQKVYKAVLKIPYGQVRSYKWVAQQIGSPRSARAVGQALKKNPFIGIVPCHRVIASDGSIGGFSKGLKKKKAMLKKEGIVKGLLKKSFYHTITNYHEFLSNCHE